MNWITPLKSIERPQREHIPAQEIRNRGVAPPRGKRAKPDTPFSKKEDEVIRQAARRLKSFADIAKLLDRTRCSIGGRARRLGVSFKAPCGAASPNWKPVDGNPWKKKRRLAPIAKSE